jgi:hypothetical protein
VTRRARGSRTAGGARGRRRAAALAAVALAPLAPVALRAQVGYPPARSPFVDLEYRQQLSILGGYYGAKRDPVGVGPQSGPVFGVQYDLGFGGPVLLTTRVRSVASERTVIDPIRPAARRVLGTDRRPLTMADVGLTLALTGQRSYRGLVPLVHGGVGVASDFAGADPGQFKFGTSFAFAYGLGARYVPPGTRWSLRADLGNSLYRLRYPNTYSTPALDSTSVLPARARLTRWLNNTAITAGVSYQFRR